MARITTRRPEEDEEDIIQDAEDEEDEVEQVAAPPVSDSRRRRQLKRGEIPVEAEVQPARKERPTPSQRPETVKSSNIIVRFFQNAVEYIQETRSELSKVAWLSREDTMRLTYIVLIVTAVSAAFLGLVGFIFGLLVQAMSSQGSTLIAGIITVLLVIAVAGAWLFRERLFGGHFE
jgi:preprotein translocase SecE subunit